ncbi:MAG: hypothetical protein QNJ77_01460 [Acidimicrobiia bacterium]|nr:hypothetical protein [Acidimicrobiia bacterium]
MVYGTEKPISPRTRLILVVVLWIVVGIPVFVALWLWAGWWSLLLLAAAVWATWDYMKTGDMFSQVDHSISHHIHTGEDGESRFGKDD